jgi:hypothetical protein
VQAWGDVVIGDDRCIEELPGERSIVTVVFTQPRRNVNRP